LQLGQFAERTCQRFHAQWNQAGVEHGLTWTGRHGWDDTYHIKQIQQPTTAWAQQVEVPFHAPEPTTNETREKAIYVRTAYRNEPPVVLMTSAVVNTD
jgi:hypothetical protein